MRLLVRLYPSGWRKRYGAEMEALIEDATPSPRNVLNIFMGALEMQLAKWSFARITVASLGAGILVAVVLALVTPARSVSQSFVDVTPPNGRAPDSARSQFDNVERYAFSREALAAIIQKYNLYQHERLYMRLDDVIANMRRDISVHSSIPTSTDTRDAFRFAVQFDYSDPRVAQNVNAELTSRLIEGNLRVRQDSSAVPTSELNSGFQFKVLDPPSLALRRASLRRTPLNLLVAMLFSIAVALVLKSRRNAATAQNG
jgi:hypothetical protein